MSVFCGIRYLNNQLIAVEQLSLMAKNLALWQPDKKSIWHNNFLGVVELQRHYTPESVFAKLPVKDSYGHLLLASNSRLDNRSKLADKLEIKLSQLKLISDEELILLAYTKWQEECSQYLLGDFTFAIWDENKQQLFLSRDQIGQGKVIYYYYQPEKIFIFASNIRPIYSYPEVPKKICESAVASYLGVPMLRMNETFYQNIYKLPPGCNLILTNNNLRIERYFAWKKSSPIRYKNPQDYIDHGKEIFTEAVRTRLRSSSKIASHISGGLDSSSVTAIAAAFLEECGKELWAYGVTPSMPDRLIAGKNDSIDDGYLMEAVAKQYENIHLNKVIDNTASLFENLSRHHQYSDSPCGIGYNRLWLDQMLQLCVEKEIRVLLCGTFGNCSISWDGAANNNYFVNTINYLKNLLRPGKYYLSSLRGHLPLAEYLYVNLDFAKKHKIINYYYKNLHMLPNRIDYSLPIFTADSGNIVATFEAITGIEHRDPTADLRLMDFCRRIPDSVYHDKDSDRLLIRKIMQGILPDSVRLRKTIGAQAPDWYLRFNNDYAKLLKCAEEICFLSTDKQYYAAKKLKDMLTAWPNKVLTAENVSHEEGLYCAVMDALLSHMFIQEQFYGKASE